MPFTCEACGGRSDLLPAAGAVLRCPRCGDERPFAKPPLLIVTGTAGIGKSTLCARLAGTIPGAVLLDADVHGEDLVSVVPPNADYEGFWRSMLRLAHEVVQNGVVVVYFSTMLPRQVLASEDLVAYFDEVHFLCLHAPPDELRARLARRVGTGVAATEAFDARVQVWTDFDAALVAAAGKVPTATLLEAGGGVDDLEQDVRRWIRARLAGR